MRQLEYLTGHLDTKNVLRAKEAIIATILAGTVTTDQLVAGTAKIDSALIEDLVVGGNVQIGSAQDAAGVTSIIGGTVTTSFVNALSVTAASVAAENITGTYITGKIIRTAASPNARIQLDTNELVGYNSSNQKSGACIQVNSETLYMYSAGVAYGAIYAGTGNMTVTVGSGSDLLLGTSGVHTYINGSTIGFFGSSAVQQSATNITKTTTETSGATYSSNEQDMLTHLKADVTQLFSTVNGVIDKLQTYGLFSEG
jgi:hypothetical protein